jgi:tetratricopeptide (TPR) repeat protein
MKGFLLPWALGLIVSIAAPAQTAPQQDFDEIARQAAAALDTNPARAAELYKQALDQRPSWPEGWFYLGGALYRLGRYKDSLDAFDKGLQLMPGNGVAWAFEGLCEYELGHLDKALSDIEKGEQIGLGSNLGFETAARQCAALILVRSSLFDRAMEQLHELAKRQVDSPGVVQVAGLCALADSRLPADMTEQRRAVVALAGKALWAATSQKPQEAAEAYNQLLQTYAKEAGVHYAHGLFLLDADQPAALKEFQQEVANTPTHWPSMLAAAFLLTRQGTPELALKSAERASQLAPASYRWLCDAEMGRALLNMDQAAQAIPLFEESIKLEPGNPTTHYYLEQAYRRVGRKADAQKEHADFVRLKGAQDPLALPGLVNSTQR